MRDSFNTRTTLAVAGHEYEVWSLARLGEHFDVARLPFSLKVLLENLLRCEDGVNVSADDVRALAEWQPHREPEREITFTPSRVVLQDFTGVPALVDLAAMRDAMEALGGDPQRINPLTPAELVIDHSVMVDHYGSADAFEKNARLEFERNGERYAFLRWGQKAFGNFQVVPPDTGIVHQVNLEHLARVVFDARAPGVRRAYPDTVVGTDSHTTMVNGLGVLGWGVGGIEAEAAMLGQPIAMLIPEVVGFRLTGRLPEGATATDLVLTVTQMLRRKGVVGKFVEFYGDGLEHLPLADRATIANMAPEYGATCGIFPIDEETLRFLELTGRPPEHIALVEGYARHQGLFRSHGAPEPRFSDRVELDLGTVQPSLAGPKRPQDRVPLVSAKAAFRDSLASLTRERAGGGSARVWFDKGPVDLRDGVVVIAAITSCTNTSNPAVMVAAGLVARKASERGLKVKPWVKTSLAPGSRVVTEYLRKAGLLSHLEHQGFGVVGYGCTTCIGNSGPLPEPVSHALREGDVYACAVLSGNRNFEGRVHAEVRMNYLASPPLVVAYALAGTFDIDLQQEPLGSGADGRPVFLRDIWPSQREVHDVLAGAIDPEMYRRTYADIFAGDARWAALDVPASDRFEWAPDSTYVRHPPYFEAMGAQPPGLPEIRGARALALLGDSITTDHISPAGSIKPDSPAGHYLVGHGVRPEDFNSYGARRGNHEVMVRGTFANVRLRNLMVPGVEGGWTQHQPAGETLTIYDAAMRYRDEGVPLVIIAGKEYGSGSSRDWAAKGPRLLGVRAVIASSFERIHRSNLVGMGVLPLQFPDGQDAGSLGLTGRETYDVDGLEQGVRTVSVRATPPAGDVVRFRARVRIDTPKEWEYYAHGGILPYVLRQLAAG
jgi:aconitate hydratase